MFKKNNIICKPIKFDTKDNTLVFKTYFLSPENLKFIEESILEEKEIVAKLSTKRESRNKQYHQQKFYYWFLSQILLKSNEYPTSDNLYALDDYIRRSLFPCTDTMIGNKEFHSPKRMSNLSYDEMERILKILQERYDYLNIDCSLIGI